MILLGAKERAREPFGRAAPWGMRIRQADRTVDDEVQVHQPVMVEEVIGLLDPKPGAVFLDLTVGAGGHASALLQRTGPDGRLLGADRDADILEVARRRLSVFGDRVRLVHAVSCDVQAILAQGRVDGVDGALMDLGVSSLQLDQPARGFSFMREGPLDMRMDRSRGQTARDLLLATPELELLRLFKELGEEPFARRIAHHLASLPRQDFPNSTTELAERIAAIVPAKIAGRSRIHPATRVFQALRIAVNDELGNLQRTLEQIPRFLNNGGHLAVIAFHSLEDRIVKNFFRDQSRGGGFRVLSKRPVVPSEAEIRTNPRSRSARLRGLERCDGREPGHQNKYGRRQK